MSRFHCVIAVLIALPSVRAQAPLTDEMKARLEKAPKFVEMFMPMRDTVVLAANVYLPPGNGPFPAILLRTPYIKDNPREPLTAQKYVEAGYAYVDQDTRHDLCLSAQSLSQKPLSPWRLLKNRG